MTEDNGLYLKRITDVLAGGSEHFVRRRVKIRGEQQDALSALLMRSPVLLLGEPGSGKTTLLEMAAFELVNSRSAIGSIPILVGARSGFELSPSTDLVTWLSEVARFDPPKQFLLQVLAENRAVILVDGLDELPPLLRDEVFVRLGRWMVEYASNQWVLSSRQIGRPAFPDLVIEALLLPLSHEEISLTVGVLFKNRQEAELLEQLVVSDRDLGSMASSPLLLRLIAQVYGEHMRLPAARADLYATWTDIALRQWDKSRGIGRRDDYLSLEATRHALSRLALWLVESSRHSFELSDWFFALRGILKVDEEAGKAAELTFRENVLGSGLVQSVGPNAYIFSHLTLQEYFASQALLQMDAADAFRTLKRITLDGVASFYADAAPDPLETARFLVSVGRLDDVRRLVKAFPGLGQGQREEILSLIARDLGIEQVLLPGAPDTKVETASARAKEGLRTLWQECCDAESPNEKGRSFEAFATALFGEVFKVVSIRRHTSFGEVDLICEVKVDGFWIRWPGDCFVECKNVRGAIPVAVANEFFGKCATVRVGLAFLMCTGKLTEPASDRLSRSWSQAESPDMAWIDGGDIEAWLEEPADAESFLKSVVRRASYGTR